MFMLQQKLRNKVPRKLENNLIIHTNILAMISINLICCCKKVFTHRNTCMIGKNSMKHHYLY